MSRINVDPLLTFQDGSHLVIRTERSKDGQFSCALYPAIISPGDRASCRSIITHLEASTCLLAQEHAYDHAIRL